MTAAVYVEFKKTAKKVDCTLFLKGLSCDVEIKRKTEVYYVIGN